MCYVFFKWAIIFFFRNFTFQKQVNQLHLSFRLGVFFVLLFNVAHFNFHINSPPRKTLNDLRSCFWITFFGWLDTPKPRQEQPVVHHSYRLLTSQPADHSRTQLTEQRPQPGFRTAFARDVTSWQRLRDVTTMRTNQTWSRKSSNPNEDVQIYSFGN